MLRSANTPLGLQPPTGTDPAVGEPGNEGILEPFCWSPVVSLSFLGENRTFLGENPANPSLGEVGGPGEVGGEVGLLSARKIGLLSAENRTSRRKSDFSRPKSPRSWALLTQKRLGLMELTSAVKLVTLWLSSASM